MGLLISIAVGAAAGFFYPRLFDTKSGMALAVVLGVVGAVVGGVLAKFIVATLGLFANLIGAVVGALAAIWLWNRIQTKEQ